MKKISCVLIFTFFLTSCAVSPQFREKAVEYGAGIGAVTGAIVGQITGRDTTGTVVGAAVGGAIGAMIGFVFKSQTNKVGNAQQTQASIPNTSKGKPVLTVKEQYLEPGEKVAKGSEVTVRLVYVVFDQNNPLQRVKEKKEILHNGKSIKVLSDDEEVRENGTYESLISFTVPEKLEEGTYQISHDIQTQDLVTYSTIDFTVI